MSDSGIPARLRKSNVGLDPSRFPGPLEPRQPTVSTNQRRHNKPVDATASSSLVRATSTAPPHHLLRCAGMKMIAKGVIPDGEKPARCRRDEVGVVCSGTPAAVLIDRIATRRTGVGSRVALRLLIAGPGESLTGGGRGACCIASRLIERLVWAERSLRSPFWNCGIRRFHPTNEGTTSRWMRRREAP